MTSRYSSFITGLFLLAATDASTNPATAAEFSRFERADCSGIASCSVSFGTVPANRIWLIKFVSCYTSVGNVNGRILYWYLWANRNSNRVGEIHLRPTSLGTTSTEHTYNATEQAYLRLPPGAIVGVAMTRDSSTAGDTPFLLCTIGGDNLPAS